MTQGQPDARLIDGAGDMLPRRRPLFAIAGVLLAIVTALLCALLPVDLPSVGTGGSAFNPANNNVALNATTSTRAALKRLVQGDDDGVKPPVSGHDALAGASMGPDPRRIDGPADLVPQYRIITLTAAPQGAAYPRGPPQA